MKQLIKNTLSYIIAIAFVILSLGSDELGPNGEVLNIDQNITYKDDPDNILGSDLGWTVTPTIKNSGGPGTITIHAKISTDIGDFSQYKDVYFEEDEIRILEFIFWEPNVWTTGSYEVKIVK